jgi:hypothetical protein
MGTNAELCCRTCAWYAPEGKGDFGRCMHAPPVIQVVMPPPTAIGSQPRPLVQGLRPPTSENDRCSKHRTLEEWLHPWQKDMPAIG